MLSRNKVVLMGLCVYNRAVCYTDGYMCCICGVSEHATRLADVQMECFLNVVHPEVQVASTWTCSQRRHHEAGEMQHVSAS